MLLDRCLPTADRLKGFTESVIREMTRVAHQYGGDQPLPGFSRLRPPRQKLVAAAAEALHGNFHQYSITWGSAEFRRALAEKQIAIDGPRYRSGCPSGWRPCGGTEAMLVALMTVCNPRRFCDYLFAVLRTTTALIRFWLERIRFMCHYGRPDLISIGTSCAEPFPKGPKAIVLCNPSKPDREGVYARRN